MRRARILEGERGNSGAVSSRISNRKRTQSGCGGAHGFWSARDGASALLRRGSGVCSAGWSQRGRVVVCRWESAGHLIVVRCSHDDGAGTSGERGRVSGQTLLLAAHLRLTCAPDLFLAVLFREELFEGVDIDEPQAIDLVAINQTSASEARDVVEGEVDDACGIA